MFNHISFCDPSTATRPPLILVKLTLLAGAICLFPIGFLSIRHSVHISLFLIFLVALFDQIYLRQQFLFKKSSPDLMWVTLALFGMSLAVAISQFIRQDFLVASFDGPSKLVMAGLITLYLSKQPIKYIQILESAIPLGLIYLLLILKLYPETSAFWGGRYATKFVDPNSMGSLSLILASLSLFSIQFSSHKNKLLLLLKIIGAIIGFYISIFAGSRGGWLAFPFLALIWFYLHIPQQSTISSSKKYLFTFLIILTLTLGIVALYHTVPAFSNRISSGYLEITGWFSGKNIDTSAGIRLSMWQLSLQLIQSNWLVGFGEMGIGNIIQDNLHQIQMSQIVIDTITATGPHSDILAKLLYSGFIGLAAYLLTLIIPWLLFWKHRQHPDQDARKAAHMGLYFVTGIFFCGLSNEMLSLKYLCSFFGLMIACLFAQIYKEKSAQS